MTWHLFGLGLAIQARLLAWQAEPISVCDLLSHRIEYASQMVVVRGEVHAGGHGRYLVADEDCKFKLVTKGLTWSNIIYLEYPDNKSPLQEDHADFQVDWRSIQKAQQILRQAGFDSQKDRRIGTFVGLFVTYFDLDRRVSPGVPGAMKLGFGPVGLEAPAQLLIKSETNVVVIRAGGKR